VGRAPGPGPAEETTWSLLCGSGRRYKRPALSPFPVTAGLVRGGVLPVVGWEKQVIYEDWTESRRDLVQYAGSKDVSRGGGPSGLTPRHSVPGIQSLLRPAATACGLCNCASAPPFKTTGLACAERHSSSADQAMALVPPMPVNRCRRSPANEVSHRRLAQIKLAGGRTRPGWRQTFFGTLGAITASWAMKPPPGPSRTGPPEPPPRLARPPAGQEENRGLPRRKRWDHQPRKRKMSPGLLLHLGLSHVTQPPGVPPGIQTLAGQPTAYAQHVPGNDPRAQPARSRQPVRRNRTQLYGAVERRLAGRGRLTQ